MSATKPQKNVIDQLQSRGDQFNRLLIQEKQRVLHLQAKLKAINNSIAATRKKNKEIATKIMNKNISTPKPAYDRVDGINPTKLVESNQKKIVKHLEGRLGKALVRRNQLECENNEIKEKINKLRRKVVIDKKNRECMEKELILVKNDIDHIMKQASSSANERDMLIEKRNQLMRDDMKKQAALEEECIKLDEEIATRIKALEKSISEAATNVVPHLGVPTDVTNGSQSNTTDGQDIAQMRDTLASLDKQISETKAGMLDNERKLRTYEAHFAELRRVSGASTVDGIIKVFIKNEEEQFSPFQHVQDIIEELEKTNEQHSALRREIDEYKQEQTSAEEAKDVKLNKLENCLENAKQERKKLYEAGVNGKKAIETLSTRVMALYFRLKCNELGDDILAPGSQLTLNLQSDRKMTMFSGQQVSERDILNLMEKIDTRSKQIIQAYHRKSMTNKNSRRPTVFMVRFEFSIFNITIFMTRTCL